MPEAKVHPLGNGRFLVTDRAGDVHTTEMTNAAAWRLADRLNNEPINKREDTADWSFTQRAND